MEQAKRIFRLVLTGGPCAGKTTAAGWIRDAAQARGWCVVFVAETATQIIDAGVTRTLCGDAETFQRCVSGMQLAREDRYLAMARIVPAQKILVVFDRGVLDGSAYVDAPAFDALLGEAGLDRTQALARYDAVIHLESAAKGTGGYMTSNNAARSETAREAALSDDRILEAWSAHPRHVVVRNRDDFNEKMAAMLDALFELLE